MVKLARTLAVRRAPPGYYEERVLGFERPHDFISRSPIYIDASTAASLGTTSAPPIGREGCSTASAWDASDSSRLSDQQLLSQFATPAPDCSSAATTSLVRVQTYSWLGFLPPQTPADPNPSASRRSRAPFSASTNFRRACDQTSGTCDGVASLTLRVGLRRHPPQNLRCSLSENSFDPHLRDFKVKSETLYRICVIAYDTPHRAACVLHRTQHRKDPWSCGSQPHGPPYPFRIRRIRGLSAGPRHTRTTQMDVARESQ